MPSQGMIHGFPYTPVSVTRNAPPQSGVYLLYRSDERPIYVGESGDLKARLLAHLISDDDDVMREAPTRFAYELVPTPAGRRARARALILELDPACNTVSFPARMSPVWAAHREAATWGTSRPPARDGNTGQMR